MSTFVAASWLFAAVILPGQVATETKDAGPSAYQQWDNGLSRDPSFFPIAVWLQAPRNAKRFREAGINLYVGLWQGPTEEQLAELKAVGHAGHLRPEPSRA